MNFEVIKKRVIRVDVRYYGSVCVTKMGILFSKAVFVQAAKEILNEYMYSRAHTFITNRLSNMYTKIRTQIRKLDIKFTPVLLKSSSTILGRTAEVGRI